jgi:hypothetical protein
MEKPKMQKRLRNLPAVYPDNPSASDRRPTERLLGGIRLFVRLEQGAFYSPNP